MTAQPNHRIAGDASVDRVERLLVAILDELRLINHRSVRALDRGGIDAAELLLLQAVHEFVGQTHITTAEILALARAPTAPRRLRSALVAAGVDSARKLGKLFARVEGRDVGGIVVRRPAG